MKVSRNGISNVQARVIFATMTWTGMASLTRRTTAPLWKTRCNVMRCCYNWFPLSCNKLKIIILCLFLAKTVLPGNTCNILKEIQFIWYIFDIRVFADHLSIGFPFHNLRPPFIFSSYFLWISFSQSLTSKDQKPGSHGKSGRGMWVKSL